jgi:hypothetical protein
VTHHQAIDRMAEVFRVGQSSVRSVVKFEGLPVDRVLVVVDAVADL